MWSNLVSTFRPRPRRLPFKKSNARPGIELLEDRVVPAVDVILEWNAVAIQAHAVDHSSATVAPSQGGPTAGSRALAIVHVAMFDAWNSINHRYDHYLTQAPNSTNASDVAAVAKAARDTLTALYPNQQAAFDAALTQTLRRVPNGTRENRGLAVGAFVADAILDARANDGSGVPMPYTPGTGPGHHNVDPLHPGQGFLSPLWGNVTPFGIEDTDNIPTRVVPALNSAEYTAAYNQVRSLGGNGTTTPSQATADQRELGIYWGYDGSPGLGTPPRLYFQITRAIADQMENTVAENARLFALVSIAMADAGIQCWGVKYGTNLDFWRPILGIRGGETDGNPFTQGDPTWTYLGAPRTNGFPGETNFTPPFPAYTSGHATFGAATFKTLANFYRTDNIPFTFISDEFNGVSRDQDGSVRPIRPRSFESFSQAAAENAASRIFLGIHWRFDATEGVSAGNRIADFIFENVITPRSGPDPNAIADSNFVGQIDAYLNNTYLGGPPPAPPAPPATPEALGADIMEAIMEPGNFQLQMKNHQLDPLVEKALTDLMHMSRRFESLVKRMDRLADSTSPKAQAALEQLHDKLHDLIFSSREMMDRLEDLV